MSNFIPQPADVYAVHDFLASQKLPNELIFMILDDARYWVQASFKISDHKVLKGRSSSMDYSAVMFCMTEPAFPTTHVDVAQKVREIEFNIASYDQGWTTEITSGTFQTSSWFELCIIRNQASPETTALGNVYSSIQLDGSIEVEGHADAPVTDRQIVRRPSEEMEYQRQHCPEMRTISWPKRNRGEEHPCRRIKEGEYSWYLQGNQVAKGTVASESEGKPGYRIVWGCTENPRWEGNKGSGKGKGFIDSLQTGDAICVVARVKRAQWTNHVNSIQMTISYTR